MLTNVIKERSSYVYSVTKKQKNGKIAKFIHLVLVQTERKHSSRSEGIRLCSIFLNFYQCKHLFNKGLCKISPFTCFLFSFFKCVSSGFPNFPDMTDEYIHLSVYALTGLRDYQNQN